MAVILLGPSLNQSGVNADTKLNIFESRSALVLSENEPVEEQELERQKIAQVISSVIGWAKDKSLDIFFNAIAHDEDYISVTPGKRVIRRFEDVKQNIPFWMSPEFKYVRHELKELEIKFARCGEVAWFYCVLDEFNNYKGESTSWENTLWTGVVEKRVGKWVVVQQHFLFAGDRYGVIASEE